MLEDVCAKTGSEFEGESLADNGWKLCGVLVWTSSLVGSQVLFLRDGESCRMELRRDPLRALESAMWIQASALTLQCGQVLTFLSLRFNCKLGTVMMPVAAKRRNVCHVLSTVSDTWSCYLSRYLLPLVLGSRHAPSLTQS